MEIYNNNGMEKFLVRFTNFHFFVLSISFPLSAYEVCTVSVASSYEKMKVLSTTVSIRRKVDIFWSDLVSTEVLIGRKVWYLLG